MNDIYDDINKPAHYCEGRIYEPIEVINDWDLGFDLGNAIKYISRCGRKGGPDKALEDLEKARYYLNHEISKLKVQKELNGANLGDYDGKNDGRRDGDIIFGHDVRSNKDWIELNGKKFEEV